MSLLDRGNADIILYPEEVVEDSDGNIRTRASAIGIPLRVTLQPQGQSGTAARRSEQDNEGYETEKVMRMRLRRQDAKEHKIGAQARIEYRGESWAIFGDVVRYMGSERTEHHDYSIRRS